MEAEIIIWEQVLMAPGIALEITERAVRDIMGIGSVFCNKVIVSGGGFRQILPMCRRISQGKLITACNKNQYTLA